MTSISKAASTRATQQGIDLDKLSEQQKKNLDADGDGEIALPEEQAYERFASSLRGDGFVDKEGAAGTNAALGQSFPGQGLGGEKAESGSKHNYLRADNSESNLRQEIDAKRNRFNTASAQLASTPRDADPRSLEQLQAAKVALTAEKAALQAKLTELPAVVQKQEAELNALLARTDVKQALAHPSQGAQDPGLTVFQNAIEAREQQLAELPDLPARDKRLGEVKEDLAGVEAALERQPSSAELKGKQSALKGERTRLEAFDPKQTRSQVADLKKSLAERTAAQQKNEGLSGQVSALRQSLAGTRGQLSAATSQLPRLQQQLDGLEPKLAHAKAQAVVGQLGPDLQSLKAQQAALGKLVELSRSGDRAIGQDRKLLAGAQSLIAEADQNLSALKMTSGYMAQHLAAASTLLQQAEGSSSVRKKIDMPKLRQYVADTQGILASQAGRIEADSDRAAKMLADPEFQEAVRRMPDADRAQLLPKLTSMLGRSEAGQAYLQNTVLPAMQKPGAEGFWGDVLKGSKNTKTALTVLDATAKFLVTNKNAPAMFQDILKNTFGVTKDQLGTIAQAYKVEKEAGAGPAAKLLEQNKLGGLIGNLKLFANVAGTISAGITIAENAHALKDGDVKGLASFVKGTADGLSSAGKVVDMLSKTSTQFGQFAGAMGKLAPMAEAVIGRENKKEAEELGDIGGAIAGSFSETGGIVGTAAIVFPPLKLASKILGWTGKGIDFMFGYNDTQKWMVRNDLAEFMK
jgi:predicted  nucleic acid-binding Zn-ribbon protein